MTPSEAELRILAGMAKLLSEGAGREDWAVQALLRRPRLRRLISQILATLATDDEASFSASVARSAVEAATKAERASKRLARIAPTPSRSLTPTVIAPPIREATHVRDVISTVLRTTDDVYSRVVARVMNQPITTEKARLQAVQDALDAFTRRGVTAFVDRAGRQWNLTSYLEMATRTALHRAATDWYAHELTKVGIDLVRVSWHLRCAPQCVPFQGRLLSLSGASAGPVGVTASGDLIEVAASLTEARARGYEHVNCRHFLTPWMPGDGLSEPDPVDPQDYADEQKLRRLERAVRAAKAAKATAITPERRASAQRRLTSAQRAIREHVGTTGVRRQRLREQLGPR